MRNVYLRAPVITTADDLASVVESRSAAWTVEEFAKLLNVSTKFIYGQTSKGLLPSYRLGGMIRLDPAQAAEWLRARSTVPGGSMTIPRGLVIYEPKGAVREYAARADHYGPGAGEAAV